MCNALSTVPDIQLVHNTYFLSPFLGKRSSEVKTETETKTHPWNSVLNHASPSLSPSLPKKQISSDKLAQTLPKSSGSGKLAGL